MRVFSKKKKKKKKKKNIFNEKKISGEMFTETPVFTYVNMSRFEQFETFFTDSFEIHFGLNKIG